MNLYPPKGRGPPMMMIERLKKQIMNEIEGATLKDWTKIIFTILIGLLILCFAINQMMDMMYSINIATDPCGICRELNPGIKMVTMNMNPGWIINLSNITIMP